MRYSPTRPIRIGYPLDGNKRANACCHLLSCQMHAVNSCKGKWLPDSVVYTEGVAAVAGRMTMFRSGIAL